MERDQRRTTVLFCHCCPSWTTISVGFIEQGQHRILLRKTRAIYQCEKLTLSPGTPTSARPLCLLAIWAIHHHELSVSTHVSNSLHTESSSCSCSLPSKTSSRFSARFPAQTAFGFCHFSMPQKVPCYFQLLLRRRGKIIIYIYLSFSARAVFPACWK